MFPFTSHFLKDFPQYHSVRDFHMKTRQTFSSFPVAQLPENRFQAAEDQAAIALVKFLGFQDSIGFW
jgi:hypothetical protein